MRRFFLLLLLVVAVRETTAKVFFDEWFVNRSLRLDYVFSGDSVNQHIALDEIVSLPYWAGRHNNLDSLALFGNGQIYVRDAETDILIYATSFSTLFQEWQHTPEAATKVKSFENCFMVPMPKRPVRIRVELADSRQRVTASLTTLVDPADILIRKTDHCRVQPHSYVLRSGNMARCVDLAIVAEGYRADQMNVFQEDVRRFCNELFAHEPYAHLKDRFNVIAVASPSRDEGASIPSQNVWRETALGVSFDTFYSERYLTTLHVKRLNDVLTGIPFDQVVVLVNSNKYGGGGIYNLYMLASAHHEKSLPVCVHEFGHSFAGLADEYDYGDGTDYYHKDVEPWEKNITTLKDFKSKWADMVEEGTPLPTPKSRDKKVRNTRVGLFEGAGYMEKGVFRPVQDCRMRVNDVPAFCPVCQRATEQMIKFLTE